MPDSVGPGEALVASGNAVETEIKLRVNDISAINDRLVVAGFHVTKPRIFESNTLYDFSDRRLRSAGSILRLRQVGEKAILTFKGPTKFGKHKTREELETAIGDGALGAAIFSRIGLIPGFRYEKYRTEFQRSGEPGIVTLDETPIGIFLELEGAPEWIDSAAEELGFPEDQYITLSYGSLYVQFCEERGVTPTVMIFNST